MSESTLAQMAKMVLFGEVSSGFCAFCGAETERIDSFVCRLHAAQVESGEIVPIGGGKLPQQDAKKGRKPLPSRERPAAIKVPRNDPPSLESVQASSSEAISPQTNPSPPNSDPTARGARRKHNFTLPTASLTLNNAGRIGNKDEVSPTANALGERDESPSRSSLSSTATVSKKLAPVVTLSGRERIADPAISPTASREHRRSMFELFDTPGPRGRAANRRPLQDSSAADGEDVADTSTALPASGLPGLRAASLAQRPARAAADGEGPSDEGYGSDGSPRASTRGPCRSATVMGLVVGGQSRERVNQSFVASPLQRRSSQQQSAAPGSAPGSMLHSLALPPRAAAPVADSEDDAAGRAALLARLRGPLRSLRRRSEADLSPERIAAAAASSSASTTTTAGAGAASAVGSGSESSRASSPDRPVQGGSRRASLAAAAAAAAAVVATSPLRRELPSMASPTQHARPAPMRLPPHLTSADADGLGTELPPPSSVGLSRSRCRRLSEPFLRTSSAAGAAAAAGSLPSSPEQRAMAAASSIMHAAGLSGGLPAAATDREWDAEGVGIRRELERVMRLAAIDAAAAAPAGSSTTGGAAGRVGKGWAT